MGVVIAHVGSSGKELKFPLERSFHGVISTYIQTNRQRDIHAYIHTFTYFT